MFRNDPPHYQNPYRYQQQPPMPHQHPSQPPQRQRRQIDPHAKLTPNQIAVITAILTNALRVQSILVDKDKTIQVLLEGSLNVQQKSELDKLVDQVRDVPVGEFLNSLLNKDS
ncbi:hypothetical protein N0O92_05270 [Alkalihalobacillus sp. MEB130]|uniref:hypothetical protein n=1 Tax=Alkalihalobacillus sp. MEB130 TaxID=2976704 RepID=UPI0028DECEB5|nr:hypothetical protein [Alkalihalobacillus sp. MEB130]MDT8859637.1 hypothetical protein [Alkalihalobacillus sp. MEB130]